MMRPMEPKRPIPTGDVLAWREGYLNSLKPITPVESETGIPQGLESGNRKTGKAGSIHTTVFTWNVPSVVTCPGISSWCMRHCYNADKRVDIFPIRQWAENWWWVLYDRKTLRDHICHQLVEAKQPIGIRLHSSGDFFSCEYIHFWESLAHSFPMIKFWAYTRSWAIPELFPELDSLRRLPNVSLFASWDSAMPPAPIGWTKSIVFSSVNELGKHIEQGSRGFICPEQTEVTCCADCGFCSSKQAEDVLFYLH